MLPLRVPHILAIISIIVICQGTVSGEDTTTPSPAQLVERLGSSDFAERQEAMRALDSLGEGSLATLRLSLRSEDLEIRRRCEELIQKIEMRLESARMIQPKRLHLIYNNVPLNEAMADFGRKAGCTIELAGDQTRLAGRKITLDSGMAPFWEVLEKFCVASGLVEMALSPASQASQPQPGSADFQLMQARLQKQILIQNSGYYNPYSGGFDPNRITLVDGQLPNLARQNNGCLRVRQLPHFVPVIGGAANDKEKTVALEITPEPGLGWMGTLAAKVDLAIDEHGQNLVQPSLFVGQGLTGFSNPYEVVQIWNGNMVYDSSGLGQVNPTHAPLRLKVGDKVAKTLKVLKGTVTGQIQTPVEPLIVVENVLKAAGKTFTGKTGGSIKVNEVSQENGLVKLKVLVEPPAQDSWTSSAAGWGGRGFRINRAVMQFRGELPVNFDPNTLEMRDERGVAFRALGPTGQQGAQAQAGLAMASGIQELEIAFQPNPGQGPPSRLVFIGRRSVTIDVPFDLKDVTLQ